MKREDIVSQILKDKLVAIVRTKHHADMIPLAECLYNNGVKIMEITLNTPGVFDHIAALIKHFEGKEMLIGAGTVIDAEGAKKAINAGAQFLVTPATPDGIIQLAHQNNVPVLAGAYTPLEILNAHRSGADIIKLFPAEHAGPAYLKAVKAPLNHIQIMPTGGVDVHNIKDWLKAGACAFGLGNALVNDTDIETKDWNKLGLKALAFRQELDN